MKQSEVDKLNIQKPEGIFTPNYSYSECLAIKNEDGEVIDYEYTEFALNKTAEEVYQEYLNPLPPQPTELEIMKQKLESQDKIIEELMFSIIPEITGGGI